MVWLSASAADLDAAANSAPPAASVSAPCCCAMARLLFISGSRRSLPEKWPPVFRRPLSHTHVLPSASVNSMPLSIFHCKRLCGLAFAATNRPKPSQSCSSDKGDTAANGFAASSARAWKYCLGLSVNRFACSCGSVANAKRCISARTLSKSGVMLLSTDSNTPLSRHFAAIASAA